MTRFATVTVTQSASTSPAGPLKVVMDGDAAHPVPCLPKTYAAVAGVRLRVEVRRSGLPPVVQGPV